MNLGVHARRTTVNCQHSLLDPQNDKPCDQPLLCYFVKQEGREALDVTGAPPAGVKEAPPSLRFPDTSLRLPAAAWQKGSRRQGVDALPGLPCHPVLEHAAAPGDMPARHLTASEPAPALSSATQASCSRDGAWSLRNDGAGEGVQQSQRLEGRRQRLQPDQAVSSSC